ncbi:MAG: alpha/beta fold hydrolase [Pseudomonadota bacterium]
MDLNFRQLGPAGPPGRRHVIIVHGLFGSASNWGAIARQLEADFSLWLVDLRNHGDSPHSDEMTYPAMGADLARFAQTHCDSPPALIGHSMGGKAAIVAALTAPDQFSHLLSMDSAPIAHKTTFDRYTDAMAALELSSLTSRKQADEALAAVVPEPGVRAFLLQNLRRSDEQGWHWRFNLPVLGQSIHTISGYPEVSGRFAKPTLFLRGGASDYVPDDIVSRVADQLPLAQLKTVPGAGHWLHAEKPAETVQAIRDFLLR